MVYFPFVILLLINGVFGESLVGGINSIDVTEIEQNQELLGAIDSAIDMENAKENRAFKLVRSSILSATSQVVQGVDYVVKVKLVSSECRNNEANVGKTLKDCPPEQKPLTEICEISLWQRPWLPAPDNLIVKIKSCAEEPQN